LLPTVALRLPLEIVCLWPKLDVAVEARDTAASAGCAGDLAKYENEAMAADFSSKKRPSNLQCDVKCKISILLNWCHAAKNT